MPSNVEFQLRDIVHPGPDDVLWRLYGAHVLKGEVVAVTDDGGEPGSFLVVRVSGLGEPVIVRAENTVGTPSVIGRAPDEKG